MHISFLLSQIFINKTVKRDDLKNMPAIRDLNNPLPHNTLTTTSTNPEKNISDYKSTQKTEHKTVHEFPVICDTVEISRDSVDYNIAAASGYGAAIGENPAGAAQSDSDKETSDNSFENTVGAVILSVGILAVIASLFFLPKGLFLTVIGALISIYGIRVCSK